jgi:hypothetical protein
VLDTARAIADLATRELAGQQPDSLPHRAAWCRIALAAHQRLLATGPSSEPAPPCRAEPQRIREWLDSPSGAPGFETDTVASHGDFDLFHYESAGDVENLVEQAQRAGVFGLPGHTVLAWYLNGADLDLDGFLVTVDTPTGHRLCSDWLPYDSVMHREHTGTDAVVHVLTELATCVDDALAGRPGRADDHDAAIHRPEAARAFPPAADVVAAPAPATPAPPPLGPAGPQRGTGSHR